VRGGAGEGQDPIVWERTRGSNVWDVDGNRFVDLTAGFGVAAAGHCNPYVVCTKTLPQKERSTADRQQGPVCTQGPRALWSTGRRTVDHMFLLMCREMHTRMVTRLRTLCVYRFSYRTTWTHKHRPADPAPIRTEQRSLTRATAHTLHTSQYPLVDVMRQAHGVFDVVRRTEAVLTQRRFQKASPFKEAGGSFGRPAPRRPAVPWRAPLLLGAQPPAP
jgi:hypothetical protein